MRYRCLHLIEHLRSEGIAAEFTQIIPRKRYEIAENVLVLLRVPLTEGWRRLIEEAKAQGKAVIYAADDLIFHPDFALKEILNHIPVDAGDVPPDAAFLQRVWAALQEQWKTRREAIQACDGCLVSTEPLARYAREVSECVEVLPNSMSRELVALSEAARSPREPGTPVSMGFMSGTKTHSHDLDSVKGALRRVMDRYPDLVLYLIGDVQVPVSLRPYGGRVRALPKVPWRDLPALQVHFEINLAPLDPDQRMNHAKSEIKWMEAAAVGVPTIASRTGGYLAAIEPDRTGVLAGDEEAWVRGLSRLIEDAEFRRGVGEAARAVVHERYAPEVQAPLTRAAFEAFAARFAAVAPGTPTALSLPGPLIPKSAVRDGVLRARAQLRRVQRVFRP